MDVGYFEFETKTATPEDRPLWVRSRIVSESVSAHYPAMTNSAARRGWLKVMYSLTNRRVSFEIDGDLLAGNIRWE